MPAENEKPKCPNCGIELEGTPEECAKCKFPLSTYPSFFSMFKTAARQLRAEEEKEQEGKPKPKKSIMDSILGPKKK